MKYAIALCLIFLMAIASPAIAEMYKWQDDDGVWHFTNQKPPDEVPHFEAEKEIRYTVPEHTTSTFAPAPEPEATPAPTSGYLNPIARVDREFAKRDLKKKLSEDYKGNYTTIKMLFDAGMHDYDKLIRIPSNRLNDRILRRLKDDYYPHFSTILMLYQSEIESYEALQKEVPD